MDNMHFINVTFQQEDNDELFQTTILVMEQLRYQSLLDWLSDNGYKPVVHSTPDPTMYMLEGVIKDEEMGNRFLEKLKTESPYLIGEEVIEDTLLKKTFHAANQMEKQMKVSQELNKNNKLDL